MFEVQCAYRQVHLVGRTLQSNEVYQQNQVASLGAPDGFLRQQTHLHNLIDLYDVPALFRATIVQISMLPYLPYHCTKFPVFLLICRKNVSMESWTTLSTIKSSILLPPKNSVQDLTTFGVMKILL